MFTQGAFCVSRPSVILDPPISEELLETALDIKKKFFWALMIRHNLVIVFGRANQQPPNWSGSRLAM